VSHLRRLSAPLRRIAGRRRRAPSPQGPGLACRELVELITDYLDGALGAAEQSRFEAHLSGCAGCRAYLAQMRTTVAATGRLAESDLDPVMRDRLLVAFRSWRSSGPTASRES
jgi:anti-sigma factor RsiW